MLKFIWNLKKPRILKITLKNRVRGFTFSDFSTYYKAMIIRTVLYWHKGQHVDQGKRTENPEIHPHTYGQMIFKKGNKTIRRGKDSLVNKWCWENGTSTCKG